jgi:hypothetical protein
MSQLNANTPYVQCYIRKEITGLDYDLEGYIFGVKSIINYPLLFHFQSKLGAIFWNIPISGFCHLEEYELLSDNEQNRLSILETWDCQSNAISVICFKFLQHKRVDVFCRDGVWRSGIYHFTIDDYETDPNSVNVGYSEDTDSKCFHFIELDKGNFGVYPNNLLRWHNADFIKPYDKNNPPKIKLNNPRISSEDVDMTYANSPYYLYMKDNEHTT